jgi:hypothetical protein
MVKLSHPINLFKETKFLRVKICLNVLTYHLTLFSLTFHVEEFNHIIYETYKRMLEGLIFHYKSSNFFRI